VVPPRFIRRLALVPLLFALTVAVVVATPLLLLIGLVASRGRHRLLRVVVIGVTWPVMECAALLASFALWIRGRTADEERHYVLCAWFLRHVYAVAARVLGLTVEIQEPLNASSDRPVIVLSRHAGPGDSFLVVHYLLNVYGRRPRIVMKATLQLDPTLDVMFNRLPNAFITGSAAPKGEAAGEIGRLAAGLGPRGAMLIFPEGGNFTPRRRVRAIRSLRRQGDHAEARRAGRMKNVLPPHVAGTLAAIEAAPMADVIFVAHTGADELLSAGDVWREIPMTQPLRARWWRVPYEEIPEADRERWLYDWWATIDTWIAENRPEATAQPHES
jgi:1-acyl-sn-glycerol-3-phosphate acyltransferase